MNIKKSILLRVRIAFLVVALFAMAIIGKIAHIQFNEGEHWTAMAEEAGIRYMKVGASRGSIFSDNGSLMATSLPFYRLAIDATISSDEKWRSGLDSLSLLLSRHFRDESQASYKRKLQNARTQGKQYIAINSKSIDFQAKKKMSDWPIIRDGRMRGGVIFEKVDVRYRPFNQLAMRTVGYTDDTGNGVVGLEYSFNDQLAGREGEALFQRISGGTWKPLFDGNDIEPEDGLDIITTIDVNLQDVAEQALLSSLSKHEAEYGSVVLMEVSTGAIKAMANLSRDANGNYGERYNYAVQGTMEPGSTFKLISLLALLDDAKLSLNDTVDTKNGAHRFYDRIMRDSNEGGYGIITLKEVFQNSSNVGFSKLIQRHFGANPKNFIKYIEKFHLHEPIGFQLKGEGIPYVKTPGTAEWYGTTLPWMSIGYELKLSPLQMLSAYNAVANNGVLVKPYLVSEIRRGSEIEQKYSVEVIENSVASDRTIKALREAMEGVVEEGTATNLKGAHFKIAGKTGTAQIAFDQSGYRQGNKITYQSSFAGYFPAEDPRYSCIVVVGAPSTSSYYGNVVAGPVFREIADMVFTGNNEFHKSMALNADQDSYPIIKAGYAEDLETIINTLQVKAVANYSEPVEWVRSSVQNQEVKFAQMTNTDGLMPNVEGMTLRDALFLLENRGIAVRYSGRGRVNEQSTAAGTRIAGGHTVKLQLQ
jgi:cell division protein FtsI (penicillin-binding protein 3)